MIPSQADEGLWGLPFGVIPSNLSGSGDKLGNHFVGSLIVDSDDARVAYSVDFRPVDVSAVYDRSKDYFA